MKKNAFLIGLMSTCLLLSSCSGDNPNPSTEPVGPTDPTTDVPVDPVEEEDYAVVVTCPTGVTYTLNKERAVFNEEVILTITSVADGFSIKDVKMNGNLLTGENNVYKFAMPNRSAAIVIRVSVSGDVVIDGDFAVSFTEVSEDVFEATAVVPPLSNSYAEFDIVIGETKLKALDLDESVSFGDISITYRSTSQFRVATGSTYKFVVDYNKDEAPFSIQRTKVDVLPNNKIALASVLIDGYAVRSEPAMFPSGFNAANYSVRDTTTKDVYWHNFTWRKYTNNTTLATITDGFEEKPDMYVYRHYDETNKTFEIVDTYKMKEGEKTVNDDKYRDSYNGYGAYSARYDVIEGDDYGYRFKINESHADRMLRSTSHQPAYLLERDLMYAYRVGFDEDDEVTSSKVTIESEAIANGFKTSIDSYVEYDSEEGVYTSDHHEAYVFDVDLEFDVRGAVTSLIFKKTVFTKDQWDFVNHQPKTGQTGAIKRRINATYSYEGESGTCSFDPSPYFISNISSYQFVNPKLADHATDGHSYMGLQDKLYIQTPEGIIPSTVSISYTPTTALDLWQYGPVSSTNEDVILHQPNDLFYTMSPYNEGDAVVTFTNHAEAPSIQGASIDVNVHVIATAELRNFYFDNAWDPSYAPVETANSAIVHANGQYKFKINASQEGAPIVYTAVSSNPSHLAITSAPNSHDLKIDTTGAASISETETITVTFESTRYAAGYQPTVFTFYVVPAQANPVGTWRAQGLDDTYMYFTTDVYEGDNSYYKGYISDHYIEDNGVDHGTDIFYFYYKWNGAYISAGIYAMDIHTTTDVPAIADMYLDFYYEPTTGRYGVFLAEVEYDDYEPYFNTILGKINSDGNFEYQPFQKIA